jgi:bifunctional DNA-binding transcriptional regulator/antitoxin component of YhaV-PrlF toxin-antitoxin module
MPTLKLHYDGWLSLPSGLRQKLGLGSGDRLEADLVDGAIVLRPAAKARRPAWREGEAADSPAADASEKLPLAPDVVPVKRKPGRPRKVVADAGEPAPAPAPRRARGRPRKTATMPEPGPAALPAVAIGPPKLLKKADLQPKATPAEPTAPPPDPVGRTRGDSGFQPVERRPFRNVEVRKLGPGRRHNKPGRQPSGTAMQSV